MQKHFNNKTPCLFLNQKYLQIFNLQIGIDVRKKQYYSSFTNENSIINFTNGAINEI